VVGDYGIDLGRVTPVRRLGARVGALADADAAWRISAISRSI